MPAEPAAQPAAIPAEPVKSSAIDPNLPPEAQILARLAARQEAFAARLLAAVKGRAANAETAAAALGLNPDSLVPNAQARRGGPFIPSRDPTGTNRQSAAAGER